MPEALDIPATEATVWRYSRYNPRYKSLIEDRNRPRRERQQRLCALCSTLLDVVVALIGSAAGSVLGAFILSNIR
jgi:hypothetical protein